MTLTPEEAEELHRLQREEQLAQDQAAGEATLDRLSAARAADAAKPRPFSIYRASVGALRDAAQGVLDASQDASHALRGFYRDTVGLGDTAANVLSGDYFLPAVGRTVGAPVSTDTTGQTGIHISTLEGEEHAGTAERVTRTIGSYLIPFAGWAKSLGIARAATFLGRAGLSIMAGAATDFTQADPVSGNVANTMRDVFGIRAPVLDSLAAEEDDSRLTARFKSAAAGAPLGLAGEALFEVGGRAVRAYRAWKGTADEAAAIVDSFKNPPTLDPKARDLPVSPTGEVKAPHNPFAANDNGAGAAGRAANDNAARAAEDATFHDIPKPEFNAAEHVSTEAPPKNFEDVVDFLKRKIGDVGNIDEETFGRFARNLLFGDPENALAKMGIDPAKLDFSMFDNPDMLGRVQRGLAEVYETYASRLGRSNLRVTEAATVSAARAFASSADVLKNLHGSTSNLAEELMGARMFVGAHSHKLLALADEATKEIIDGTAGEKWAAFMEAFHRHAYYLGAVRGAGSEVGRALRSLQTIAQVGKAGAGQAVGRALENEAAAQNVVRKLTIPEGASAYADKLVTDAQKLEALAGLKALGGDVGELSRGVRRENFSILKRLSGAVSETVGNLFTVGTAVYNVAAGATMLGTRVLAKSMSAMARSALALGGGDAAGVAARASLMDTWAYTHGIVAGFGDAYRNALLVLEKEGGSELTLNLDTIGLREAAKAVAANTSKAAAKLGTNTFERVKDLADVTRFRHLAVLPSELEAIQAAARDLPGPKFFQEGLAALARITSSAVNLYGSLSRAGTILFINAPDEFMGTLAARAGAYSHAVRTAASEAAELGLEGSDLSKYLKARTVQLSEHTPGWHEDGFDAGVHEAMGAVGESEAREILFQDDLELGFNRSLAQALGRGGPLLNLIVPFVKTPLRILERTAIDYSPLGLFKDRIRKAIAAGGPARDEAIARLALGTIAVATGYALAEDRTIVGNDGGYTSSARLSRDSYSLKIGDDAYQFSRIDPLGTLLGFGADMHSFYQSMADDPDAPGAIQQATEAFLIATASNILSKTWLASLRNLTDLAGATSDEDFKSRVERFSQTFGTRFVPAAGVQRQIEAAGDGFLRQAMTFNDQLMRASIGGSSLPVKRDPLLGRPVPLDGLNRLIGVRGGPTANAADDPLQAEMERLSFKVPGSQRTVEGVKLNATQYSRFLELKGQVVKDPRTGLTLEQTLAALVQLPAYQQLPDAGRVEAIRTEMKGFSRLATGQMIREDHGFAYKVLQQETFARTLMQPGGTPDRAAAETARLAQQLGLKPPQ